MSRNDKKEWTDDREGGSGGIIDETECCANGECCWHPNTPAQSEQEGGEIIEKAI